MLRLINSTPFETNITLHGSLRIKQSPNDIHSKLNNLPPWQKWFTEWFYILKDGPIYKQIDYCIDPWTTYECIISPIDSEMTEIVMGFNDVRTQWTRHTPGIFHWDNKFAEVNITCKPGKPQIQRQRRGPNIYGDIPLQILTESDNLSFLCTELPITRCKYTPSFNENYYTQRPR